jgi:hypothetical protein
MVVVPVGVLIAAKMIPRPVMEECQAKAREVAEGEKSVSRVAAVSSSPSGCCASRWLLS